LNRQSAPGNDIGTTISLVCPRVFYFRPPCFVVGREFVRGRQHISKSARRVSARVLRRGCWAEGRREKALLCVFVCASAVQPSVLSLAGSAQPGSQLCQRFQCEQECCFSPPAVYAPQSVEFRVALCWRRAAASRPDYFASWEAKCSDILTAEFPTREKVNRSRLTFAVLFYFLFGF
jgi:hypothetical protein